MDPVSHQSLKQPPSPTGLATKCLPATPLPPVVAERIKEARPRAAALGELLAFSYGALNSYPLAYEVVSKLRQIETNQPNALKPVFQKRWHTLVAAVAKKLGANSSNIEQTLSQAYRSSPPGEAIPLRELLKQAGDRGTESTARFDEYRERYYQQAKEIAAFFQTLGAPAATAEDFAWLLRSQHHAGATFSFSGSLSNVLCTLLQSLYPQLQSLDIIVKQQIIMKPVEMLSSAPLNALDEINLCELAVRILKRFGRHPAEVEDSYQRALRAPFTI